MAAVEQFVEEARQLGFEPAVRDGNRVVFAYEVPVGRFAGLRITLGFEVPPDFDRTPPSGPHISPRIMPINTEASRHPERVAPSPFGEEFEYLSRPYEQWGRDGRTLSAYMAHVRNILGTS